MLKNISIRGAREHNLKNVDVEIPRDTLTVLTGLSGSGKSSLAFDTIYAEGQRRYVEIAVGLCPPVPGTDAEAGCRPYRGPVAGDLHRAEDHLARIPARRSARSPRSTTICACCSRASACPIRRPPACPSKARPSARWPTASWRCPKARGFTCWRRSCAAARANTARNSPSCRRRASSASRSTANTMRSPPRPALDKKLKHDIEIVVDRIAVKKDIGNRLPDSIETALGLADGLADRRIRRREGEGRQRQKQMLLSSKFACPVSGFTIPEIEPRLFSFNNPHGACPECDGLGTQIYFDEALVVPDAQPVARRRAPSRRGRNPPRPIICRRWKRWRGITNSR